MDQQFKRIIDLVRRTGDRLIVTDTDGKNSYVIMDLDQYELLVDLESEFLEEETPDFYTENKPQGEKNKESSNQAPEDIWQAMKPANQPNNETWDINKISNEDREEVVNQYNNYRNKQNKKENISEENTKNPVDQNIDEDQFYLEPIE